VPNLECPMSNLMSLVTCDLCGAVVSYYAYAWDHHVKFHEAIEGKTPRKMHQLVVALESIRYAADAHGEPGCDDCVHL
jgi:hypothetical protein